MRGKIGDTPAGLVISAVRSLRGVVPNFRLRGLIMLGIDQTFIV
jgi:hypothetical protein